MKKETGCLIIHGFGGSVAEITPLCQYLQDCGYLVQCPTLEGHTGKRKDLRGIKYTDWIKTGEESYLNLKQNCRRVHLIGFSMGGLIAVNLALKYHVDSIVTINTPIYYWDIKRIIRNILVDLQSRKFTYLRRYLKSSTNAPFSALVNFRLLLQNTKPKLQKIKNPFLVIQAKDDDTVRSKSADYIFNNIASLQKDLKYYDQGGHLILKSSTADKVIRDIKGFLTDKKK